MRNNTNKWIEGREAIQMINCRREIIRKNITKYKFCKGEEKAEVIQTIKLMQSGIRSIKRQTYSRIEFSYEDNWKPRNREKKKEQKIKREDAIELVMYKREIVRRNIKKYKQSEYNDKDYIVKTIRQAQKSIKDVKDNCATIPYSYEDDWSPCKRNKWGTSY